MLCWFVPQEEKDRGIKPFISVPVARRILALLGVVTGPGKPSHGSSGTRLSQLPGVDSSIKGYVEQNGPVATGTRVD